MDPEQRQLCNRIVRCLERLLLSGGGALDAEALCVQPSHWVWKLTLAVTILDAGGGNVLDACVVACLASLRHYRRPHVQQPSGSYDEPQTSSATAALALPPTLIPADWKEPTPLPLHHTPLCVSMALIERPSSSTQSHSTALSQASSVASSKARVAVLVDPSAREELVQSGVVTLGMNAHGELLLLDFGGGCELTPVQLRHCHNAASQLIPTLCKQLDESLRTADDQARDERLKRLQKQQHSSSNLSPPLPTLIGEDHVDNTDYDTMRQSEQVIGGGMDAADLAVRKAASEAEEAYRAQALDYNRGHAPVAIRENSNAPPRTSGTSSLLAYLLQSVTPAPTQAPSSDSNLPIVPGPMTVPNEPAPPSLDVRTDLRDPTPQKPQKISETPWTSTSDRALGSRLDSEDDDEEEETLQLRSEFAALEPPQSATKSRDVPPTAAPASETAEVLDDEVDDLAAAIKKRKKKSKKK